MPNNTDRDIISNILRDDRFYIDEFNISRVLGGVLRS